MKKIKLLFAVAISAICLAACSEDEPARMNWEVAASPKENVKAVFDPMFYNQIQITTNGEVGEVTLKCTNYRNLILQGANSENGEYIDTQSHYTAKITENGTVKITFDRMPNNFNERTTLLHIEGNDGKHSTGNTVEICRKP